MGWIEECLPGVPTVKLLFFPFCILFLESKSFNPMHTQRGRKGGTRDKTASLELQKSTQSILNYSTKQICRFPLLHFLNCSFICTYLTHWVKLQGCIILLLKLLQPSAWFCLLTNNSSSNSLDILGVEGHLSTQVSLSALLALLSLGNFTPPSPAEPRINHKAPRAFLDDSAPSLPSVSTKGKPGWTQKSEGSWHSRATNIHAPISMNTCNTRWPVGSLMLCEWCVQKWAVWTISNTFLRLVVNDNLPIFPLTSVDLQDLNQVQVSFSCAPLVLTSHASFLFWGWEEVQGLKMEMRLGFFPCSYF